MRGVVGLLGLLIGVALVGCGGGSDQSYAIAPIQTCLIEADVRVDPDKVDRKAAADGVGAFRADLGKNEVIVVVEPHAPDAEDTQEAHETFGAGSVERRGNLVLAWDTTPTARERRTIERCLSS